MAWRMLMTPTLPAAAEPAAAGACAQAAALLKMHAAAKATVRSTNLEFTLFSLLWSATVRPRRTRAKSAWLKIDSAPRGLLRAYCKLESIADAVYFPQSESKIAQTARRLPHQELFRAADYFGNGNKITRLLA
jgi:hypothetical protein